MVFKVPALHHSSTLRTETTELKSCKSQTSLKYTSSNRFKFNRIFKKLLNNDPSHENTVSMENEENISLSKSLTDKNEPEKHEYKNENINKLCPKATMSEPFEQIPFTKSYLSTTSKNEIIPFELSTYHKNCTHRTKSSSTQTNTTDTNQCSLISNDQPNLRNTINMNDEMSNESFIGLKYAFEKCAMINSHGIRLPYSQMQQQQQAQRLRRLNNTTKVHSISSQTKHVPFKNQRKMSTSSKISSSIAHRIELLKNAMKTNRFDVYQCKLKTSHQAIHTIDEQSQPSKSSLKIPEFHHIHYHHIYSSILFPSIQWRTCLSVAGTLSVLFLIVIQFIMMIF